MASLRSFSSFQRPSGPAAVLLERFVEIMMSSMVRLGQREELTFSCCVRGEDQAISDQNLKATADLSSSLMALGEPWPPTLTREEGALEARVLMRWGCGDLLPPGAQPLKLLSPCFSTSSKPWPLAKPLLPASTKSCSSSLQKNQWTEFQILDLSASATLTIAVILHSVTGSAGKRKTDGLYERGFEPDGGQKKSDLFDDVNCRKLVANLPLLGALPCSEMSCRYLQTLFPPGKIHIFNPDNCIFAAAVSR